MSCAIKLTDEKCLCGYTGTRNGCPICRSGTDENAVAFGLTPGGEIALAYSSARIAGDTVPLPNYSLSD